MLTEALRQLRSGGLQRPVGGPDVLRDADAPDAVLDEFLSLAVREAADVEPDTVLLGLALSIPVCVVDRGAGREALEYCLAHPDLAAYHKDQFFPRMSMRRGARESLPMAHERVREVATRAGDLSHYYAFVRDNVEELLDQCPEALAAAVLAPGFASANYGVDTLALVIGHSRNPEPFVRSWITSITQGQFDTSSADYVRGILYAVLGREGAEPGIRPVREAAHAHVVRLLQSPATVAPASRHLSSMVKRRYPAAAEVLASHAGARLDREVMASEAIRVPLTALRAVAYKAHGR